MAQLENNSQTADSLIQEIYSKLSVLQNHNPELVAEVQNLLQQIRNGGSSGVRDARPIGRSAVTCAVKQESAPTAAEVKSESASTSKSGKVPAPEVSKEMDIGGLDLRIGLIKECSRHPDADSLEKIGVDEDRTCISCLVTPLFCGCNHKPSKMRRIMSESMAICAGSPEKAESLVPPQDIVPGRSDVRGLLRRPAGVLVNRCILGAPTKEDSERVMKAYEERIREEYERLTKRYIAVDDDGEELVPSPYDTS